MRPSSIGPAWMPMPTRRACRLRPRLALSYRVRGMEAPMEVVGILRGRDLPASILAAAAAEGPKTTAQRLKHQALAANPWIGP